MERVAVVLMQRVIVIVVTWGVWVVVGRVVTRFFESYRLFGARWVGVINGDGSGFSVTIHLIRFSQTVAWGRVRAIA